MAKFLNKKEQVYDLKLTTYGKYLLSNGTFKPEYYAFFDDNIIYDYDYARTSGSAASPSPGLSGSYERQNEIIGRIRETPYIESLTLFEDAEKAENTLTESPDGSSIYYDIDLTPAMITPRKDNYIFSAMIGDAYLDGDTQNAPAWKMVALNGEIKTTSPKDVKNDIAIPQLNIELNYSLEIVDSDMLLTLTTEELREILAYTDAFADNRSIKLTSENLLVYGEEMNTELLTENFDIEIFEVDVDAVSADCIEDGCYSKDLLRRRYFSSNSESIQGGLMAVDDDGNAVVKESLLQPKENPHLRYIDESKVGYYFDVVTDKNIENATACKSVNFYNRNSYYIDIDHDCSDMEQQDNMYVDIYGKVTEPEICL